MPRHAELPDSLGGKPFRFGDARTVGVTRDRLRAADLHRPHHGLYAARPPAEDPFAACEMLLPLLGEHQAFSHLTAARLWGMPLPFSWTPDEPIHVLTAAGAAPMRRSGVVGWETEDAGIPRRLRGALPVVAPADVWCQLAVRGATGRDEWGRLRGTLTHEWLVAAADFLLTGPRVEGRRAPLVERDELAVAIRRRWGKRGVLALAEALDRVRAGAQSPPETFLRLGLVDRGLPEPEVQVPVQTAAGLRHADLGYPVARLLLEYQGDHHRTDRRQWLEDLTRVQLFQDAGYRVILIGADDLDAGIASLAARIRRALRG